MDRTSCRACCCCCVGVYSSCDEVALLFPLSTDVGVAGRGWNALMSRALLGRRTFLSRAAMSEIPCTAGRITIRHGQEVFWLRCVQRCRSEDVWRLLGLVSMILSAPRVDLTSKGQSTSDQCLSLDRDSQKASGVVRVESLRLGMGPKGSSRCITPGEFACRSDRCAGLPMVL